MATKKAPPPPPKRKAKQSTSEDHLPRPPGRRGAMPGERFGGREKGAKNKKTIIKEQLEKVKAMAPKGDLLTPLQFMLSVVNDKNMPTRFRGDMAKNAAPYVHPKLIAITAKTTSRNVHLDAADLIAEGKVDAEALYRDIMGQGEDDEEAEDE